MKPMHLYRHAATGDAIAGRSDDPRILLASARLRDATLLAILGHADRAGVGIDTAARKLLSDGERV